MKNEQINKLAAEAMGICWHENIKVYSNEFIVKFSCEKCHQDLPAFREIHLDFCNDLNAAKKLFYHVSVVMCQNVSQVIYDLTWNKECTVFPDLLIEHTLTLPPKTITLAALVAKGKITPEQAKEILNYE